MEINIQRIRKDELQQSIDDLKERGWQQVTEITNEIHHPKRFTASEKKRFNFERHDCSNYYQVKMRSPIVSPKRAKMTKDLNILHQDVFSMFRKLLETEEKAIKQYDKLSCRYEKSLSEIETLKVENEMLRKELKSLAKKIPIEEREYEPIKRDPVKTNTRQYEAVVNHMGREMSIGWFKTQEAARKAFEDALESLCG